MEIAMKSILFYIHKFFHVHGDDDIAEPGRPGEHLTVGLYAMLCNMQQGSGGRGEH